MAEALGCAASILAVIQLAGAVTALGYNYIAGVKRATNDMQQLVDELTSLGKVLGGVRQFADTNPKSATINLLNEPDGPLQGCSRELDRLRLRLQPKGGSKGFIESLKWALKEQDTLQHISALERHKNLFIFALTADQISLSKVIEAYVKNIDLATRQIEIYTRNTALVLEDLRKDVRSGFEAQSDRMKQEDKLLTAEKQRKALDWLYPQSFDKKHHEIRRRRQENTGDWLSQTITFQAWVMGQPNLLWGYGIPGAGKTFLSSKVIDHLLARALKTNSGVAYIYFEFQEQESQKPDAVLACLIKQLALQIPQGVQKINDLYESNKRPEFGELYDILSKILKSFKRTFFILDALDECHEEDQRGELLPFFRRLCSEGASIFLTSRPHPEDIQQFVADCDATKIELLAQEDDIVRYIEAMIDRKPRAKRLVSQGGFKDRIVSHLTECSNGMFLLVHFHITLLCQQTTAKQILKELDKIKNFSNEERPLDPTYDRAMENIRRQPRNCIELAIKIFSWLLKARRTLTVDELQTAVSVEDGLYELDELDLPDRMTLLDVCAGLVTIDHSSGDIRLAHYTVKEYLIRANVIPHDADFQVTMACITYVSFDFLAEGPCINKRALKDRFQSNPFLDYAVPHLSKHIACCDESLSTDLVLKFVRNPGSIGSFVQCLYQFGSEPFILQRCSPLLKCYPPLHVASILGHATAIKQLLAEGANISARDGVVKSRLGDYTSFIPKPSNGEIDEDGDTPLGLAVIGGHLPVVKLLVDHGADVSAVSCQLTPLVLSMRYGHDPITKFLLDRGAEKAELFAVGHDGFTPLIEASLRGFYGLVKILLDHGADVSATSTGNRTALMFAARNGNEPISKLLLEYGTNASAADEDGVTVILLSVTFENMSLTKMLLDYGADPSPANNWGFTALMFATTIENEAMAKMLLDYGADLSVTNKDGNTALFLSLHVSAVRRGATSMTKLLLDRGADISVVDNAGSTALIYATITGNETSVKTLLEHGADPSARNKEGNTALLYAVTGGFNSIAKLLLDHKADPSTARNGHTALMQSIVNKDKPMARMFLDYGADIAAVDNNGHTAISYAVINGFTSIVKMLLDYKADPSTANDGITILMHAVRQQDTPIVKMLLDRGADISALDNRENSVLFYALMERSQSIVELLLDYKANISALNNDKYTPVLVATYIHDVPILKLLLDHGADTSAVDKNGDSALLYAVKNKLKPIVKILLDYKANASTANNKCTALMHTVLSKDLDMVKMLLAHGADRSAVDNSGRTALMLALQIENYTLVKILLEHGGSILVSDDGGNSTLVFAIRQGAPTSVVKMLIDHGADLSTANDEQSTALIYAVISGNDATVKVLLDHGADTSAVNNKGNTPLLYSVINGFNTITKLLLDYQADPSTSNNDRYTPLMVAVLKQEDPTVKMLLDYGADTLAAETTGRTALMCATLQKNKPISKMLLDHGADPSAMDNMGFTAFMFTVQAEESLLKMFLEYGIDLSCTNKRGDTILHIAAHLGKLGQTKMLLDWGADPSVLNKAKNTPLMLAEKGGHKDVVQLLEGLQQ